MEGGSPFQAIFLARGGGRAEAPTMYNPPRRTAPGADKSAFLEALEENNNLPPPHFLFASDILHG